MVNRESVLLFDKEAFEIEKKRGVFMLYSEKYSKWIKTSETGKDILFNMDGQKTVEDIIHAIAEEYEMPKRKIQQHVEDFCKHVEELEFVGAEETSFTDQLKHLYVDVTDACNLTCSYCNKCTVKENDNPKHMSVEGFKEVLNKVEDRLSKKTTIHISGGEPLLNPNIIEILKIAREKTQKIILWTNGTMINQEMARELKKYVMASYLALDSSQKNINDEIRGIGSYDSVIDAMKILKTEEMKYWLAITPIKANKVKISEIVDLANECGALGVYINQPIKTREDGTRIENKFFDNIDEYTESENKLIKKGDLVNSWRNNNDKKKGSLMVVASRFRCLNTLMNVEKKPNCGVCSKELNASNEGEFFPCSMLHVKDMKIHDLKEAQDIYGKRSEECSQCEYRMFCLGGCKAVNYHEGKDMEEKNVLCEFIKRFFHMLTWG